MTKSTLDELNKLKHFIWWSENSDMAFSPFVMGDLSQQRSPKLYAQALDMIESYPEAFVLREERIKKPKVIKDGSRNKKRNKKKLAEDLSSNEWGYSLAELQQKLDYKHRQAAMIEKYGRRKRRRKHGRKSSGVTSNIVRPKDEKLGMYNYIRSRKREWHYENDDKTHK